MNGIQALSLLDLEQVHEFGKKTSALLEDLWSEDEISSMNESSDPTNSWEDRFGLR